jgi:hypothetical protein
MEMVWSQEIVEAEVLRRHEDARHNAHVRQLREARGSWWRRLWSEEPAGDRDDREPRAA